MYATDTTEQKEIIVLADNIDKHIKTNERSMKRTDNYTTLNTLLCKTKTLRDSKRKLMNAYYKIEEVK